VNTDRTIPELPTEVSAKALLGLAGPVGFSTAELHAFQARSMKDGGSSRFAVTILCMALIIAMSFGIVPLWASAIWGAAVVAVYAYAFDNGRPRGIAHKASPGRKELMAVARHSGVSGVIWGSSMPLLGWYGEMTQMLGIWTVCLVTMVYSSLLMPNLPLGSVAFISAVSLGGVVGWAMEGGYYLAAAAVVLAGLLAVGVVRNARSQVMYQLASKILQEKSETVSLLLREFEDSGADWLWQTNPSRSVTHVSPRFAYALNEDARTIEGQPLLKLIAGDAWETGRYPDALHDLAERLKRREAFSDLIVPVTINGIRRWWELSASPRNSETGAFLGFRGVGSDVTEQRESAEKISHLARFDTLTGLPNRLQLTETLGRALTEAEKWRRRCGFFMIDLDRFKAVNDTLGHPVGDRLLAQVAKRLKMAMSLQSF
jgi:PAS domain-containing protein